MLTSMQQKVHCDLVVVSAGPVHGCAPNLAQLPHIKLVCRYQILRLLVAVVLYAEEQLILGYDWR